MPVNRRLKVFRTSIGFHDAYVAVPSQKAALQAWGANKDLFAIGFAAVVTDPALTAEPLARPGTVIKRLRASTEEQLSAAGRQHAQRRREAEKIENVDKIHKGLSPPPRKKPQPLPSRKTLDTAEASLAAFELKSKEDRSRLQQKEDDIQRERKALEERQDVDASKLRQRVATARKRYEEAMETWRRQEG
jgi:hypothetical protein